MKAVIMAGGEGTRLRPLTYEIPKPMVPVANRPVMEHILDLAKMNGITQIAVTLQYFPSVIKSHFRDGSSHGVDLKYFTEGKPLGTAGSVRNAASFLDETFIVISGDAITDVDIKDALGFHMSKDALVTLVLKKVEIPLEYGVVVTGEDGRIISFIEKPGWGEVFSDTVNTGIYIMSPQILKFIDEGKKKDFSRDIFPILFERNIPMYGYITGRYWCDMGDIEAYTAVHRDIMDKKVDLNINGEEREGVWYGDKCRISGESVIEPPCILGDGCVIRGGAVTGGYSVVGNNCYISEGVTVRNSVLWDRCLTGQNTVIQGAIVCDRTITGKGVSILSGSAAGPGCVIHDEARINSGIKLWPGVTVEQGMEINRNVVSGKSAGRRVFSGNEIKGKAGMTITPEFAARLGASFASCFGKEAHLLAGSDGEAAAEMINCSLCMGMLSAGADVTDSGTITKPVLRSAIRFLEYDGGVFSSQRSFENDTARIVFFNRNGAYTGSGIRRKMEQLLARDEYRCIDTVDIKRVRRISGYTEFHFGITQKSIRSDKFDMKAALISGNSDINSVVSRILTKKGCNAVFMEGLKPECFCRFISDKGYDIGAVLDYDDEEITFIDNRGRCVGGETLKALVSYILLKEKKEGIVAAPVSASSILESMASEGNCSIIRTKDSIEEVINTLAEKQGRERLYNTQFLFTDPASCLLLVMDYLTQNGIKLSKAVDMLPGIHMSRIKVRCPGNMKGVVMRSIIEEQGRQAIETQEGIKIQSEKGWVLIAPDNDRPVFNVVGEGSTQEFAEELTGIFAEKIRYFTNQ